MIDKLNKSILYDTLKKPINAKKLFTRLWGGPTQYIVLAERQLKHFNCIKISI